MDRRTVLRRSAVVTAGLLAGCAGGGGSSGGGGSGGGGGTPTATPTGTPAETASGSSGDGGSGGGSYEDWLSNVGNYDGTVADRTGQSTVTVTVGAEGNGGNFAFGPPAVRVDAGTKVTWKWNGKGGQHNVAAESGADFSSDLVGEAGHTFSWTPASSTTATYYCQPHRTLGMKGVVVVE